MNLQVNGEKSQDESKRQRNLHILELPAETLDAIFAHAGYPELLNLCLVSKAFRELAVTQLYRQFSHTFNDFEDRIGHVLVDRLAAILETLVTSDYNYAQYIKEISMDTAYAGDPGERACREYSYEYSCGKFLNTLLLAALKRTTALETFQWNIRVELSTAVFKALHRMPTLQHLHVRLHSGTSLNNYPMNQSYSVVPLPPPPSMPPSSHPHHPPHHAPPFVPYSSSAPQISMNSAVKPPKRVTVAKPLAQKNTTFSGFKGLSVLTILDMDTLDYVSEIAECIRGSSGTLKELKLSFSDNLALKARKKVVQESDTETAQDDDELFDDNGDIPTIQQPAMIHTPPLFGPGNASTDADVRRERTAQEKALAKMFGLEKDDPKAKKLEKAAEDAIAKADKEARTVLKNSARKDADRLFVKELKTLMSAMHATTASNGKAQRVLEKMDKAATEYLKGCEEAEMLPKKSKSTPVSPKKHSYKYKPSNHAQYHPPPPPKPGQIINPPYIPSHPSIPGDTLQDFDFDSFLANEEPPPFPAPIYGANQTPKPYGKYFVHPKKIVIKKKDGSSHTMYKGSNEYNAFFNPPGLNKPGSSSKGKGKALSTQSSSLSSASSLTWDDHNTNGLPVIPLGNSSGEKLPKDEYDDDIDMATPDVVDDEDEGEDQEFLETSESSGENHVVGADEEDEDETSDSTPIPHQKTNGVILPPFDFDMSPSKGKGKGKEVDKGPPSPKVEPRSEETAEAPVTSEKAIQEYVRLSHGIPLEKLSIYLIPVIPSILFRAIDFSALKSISLLNVGPQRRLWAALTKLQESYPLQLKSIYVDNVTPAFLVFLNGLNDLEELFMLERHSRTKVESFAPKTVVSIEDIRKQALKKHMKTLKRLIIRNDDDATWALNKETVRLITQEGQNLRELVVALAPPTFHFFMQTLGSLTSLHAIQIISVNTDNCRDVQRETRHNVIDNISHYPYLQIEYVALSSMGNGNMATQLTRLVKKDQKGGEMDGDKGLSKLGIDGELDEEDDGLRFKVVEGVRLKDAVGVRIWEKEIWGGRL